MVNGELQTETGAPSPETRQMRRGNIKAKTRAALMATWAKLSPNFDDEPLAGESPKDAERRLRIAWANSNLHLKRLDSGRPDITSFNELSEGEARHLLRIMREESGDGPSYRAMLIGRLAVELFGSDWDAILRERLLQRFRVPSPESLAPNQAHAEIEELVSRIARRDGVNIEEVRKRVKGKG